MTPGSFVKRPSNVTLSCVNRVLITRIASSVRAPRCLTGTPTASNSLGYSPPMPTPIVSRPPEMTSTEAISLAASAAGRRGSSITAVPRRMREVRAAMAASIVRASKVGK